MAHLDKPSPQAVARYWHRLLKPYAGADDRKAWFQLITTGALFAANWVLMLWSLQVSYLLTLLLAIPAAGLLTRLFIFQHDCGHGSFFHSQRLSDVVGRAVGVLTLVPYDYWRRTHAIHHGTSGDLDRRTFGEVVTLTDKEYQERSRWGRLKYRLYRHPLVLLGIGPTWQFVFKHRLPLGIPLSWRREWKSVLWTNVGLAAVIGVAWWAVGIEKFLLVQVPITLISGALGVWLFYIQHQFEDTYWREHEEWNFHRAGIEGSSYYDLPRVLHWFTGNIGFHHIHHLASRIPNYRLEECFRSVPELSEVTRLTILGSLRCARFHLWSEEEGKLISFRQFRQAHST